MRVLAPDLPGMESPIKPAAREDYSYERQVDWMSAWLEANDFRGLTLFGQDWGGLIGLRLVARLPERFERSSFQIPRCPTTLPWTRRSQSASRSFWSDTPTQAFPACRRRFPAWEAIGTPLKVSPIGKNGVGRRRTTRGNAHVPMLDRQRPVLKIAKVLAKSLGSHKSLADGPRDGL